MSENENKLEPDSGKNRSPRSPLFTIDEAISRARKVYKEDKRAWAAFENVAKHMGFSNAKKGGRTGRAVSALKQYGLLDEEKGRYRISEMAQKIIELPDSDPERGKLILKAALKPPMIEKVLKHYNGELPSNDTVRSYLLFDEKFTPDGATDFVKVVRRTFDLVKESGEDYNAGESSEGEEPPDPLPPGDKPRMQGQMQQPPAGKTPPPKPPAGQRTYPLYLSKETEAVLYAPSVMSQSEYDLLKAQIDNSLKVMLATSVLPDKENSDEQ